MLSNLDSWRNQPTIFISHSSKDLLLGRATRNIFEDLDHHVLLLGLLQDMTEYEAYALLDKEIKARDWLILLDSEAANESQWVQFELDQAKEYGKEIHRINAERFSMHNSDRYALEKAIRPCVTSFSRSIRIFPSYSFKDQEQVQLVLNVLIDMGYQVWNPVKDIRLGSNWKTEIEARIKEASVILVFITADSVNSRYTMQELTLSRSANRPIIPVLLGSAPVPNELEDLQYILITNLKDPTWQDTLELALKSIRQRLMASLCE